MIEQLLASLLRPAYWVLCLPLEGLRALSVIPVLFLRAMSYNLGRVIWFLWWLDYVYDFLNSHPAQRLSPEQMGRFDEMFKAWFFMGICYLLQARLRYLPFMPAFWRLSPRKQKPVTSKEIVATIPIKSHAEAKQTRQAMTARLHPDLQAYLAKATKP
jgi:hypothetical protein